MLSLLILQQRFCGSLRNIQTHTCSSLVTHEGISRFNFNNDPPFSLIDNKGQNSISSYITKVIIGHECNNISHVITLTQNENYSNVSIEYQY